MNDIVHDDSAAPQGGPTAPSLVDALIPCITLVILLSFSFVLFGNDASSGPNQVALLFCGIVAASVAYKNGLPWAGIRQAVIEGIAAGLPAILILLAVGALIGTWAMSGTIVSMVYFGLKLLNPTYFYATAALVCAVVAFSIGSSWTVAGAIGIGLMGVAANMGLSPAITAGAVISGAYFGDVREARRQAMRLEAQGSKSRVTRECDCSYAGFCFFNILSSLLAVAFGFLGWRIVRAKVPEARQTSPAPA